ncbi:Putative transcriptional regulator, PucR family OS=Tsukamurella paurometabola (strain ATCC 8368 /DSM / CCUG 35730 / CIP 100753 / JCM 10117 / KCTC 9821/ NBRC 16120 / NCIMB 702349 / NCTC 13040) OX=521096 GN=Tpau_2723 PE=3 SV=1 [Tsukamurella paurometabola]|uniref:Putative transcriptional regulator, PucR family n=1 Tax=Tsukamurella paurometabola (strain ATCC 8368 / DSM 20162 / CCUG 35730 / CIP 100753 / JCM 10117 / KCTC 9821 / NBRC 16120 / NCIMB 702349 / NCTC 13040) TaxID=521096 RepID=D5USQ0_TSUPD|nr:helix-turn-helix domain-containing protein [Tsukamurella paurometabola]ADG79321.1 putative transcriptional regulator, PucR family [Tsukamurella paurometabola DSM 20162]SUP35074.1 Sugar diacid utilization regulator [Tsukamurella paurometabola]
MTADTGSFPLPGKPGKGSFTRKRPEPRDVLPEAILSRIRQYSGRVATEAVRSMEVQLPYFADLEANQRASIQLIVQTAVVNFAEWIENPDESEYTVAAFQSVPQDLARRVSLLQTVEMVRVAMEFFEKWLPLLARNEDQLIALTEAVLRYGREIGFGAAAIYASAAEARGAWDSRMEALVVDAVVRGDTGANLLSRAAALNWDPVATATVVVGSPPPDQNVSVAGSVHDTARSHGRSALAVVQGTKLVVIASGALDSGHPFTEALMRHFADGPVVIGHTTPTLEDAHASAVEAIAGVNAVAGWPGAPRPVHSWELLPERALIGDTHAGRTLYELLVQPLEEAGSALSDTLDAYIDSGGAVESCARELFVHPNTVRYRLKKIAEITGRDPQDPRDAFVLRVAATIGRLAAANPERFTPAAMARTTDVTLN